MGHPGMRVAVLAGFDCYLGISEIGNLRKGDVVDLDDLGPATLEQIKGKGVKVQFDGHQSTVDCYREDLSREAPSYSERYPDILPKELHAIWAGSRNKW